MRVILTIMAMFMSLTFAQAKDSTKQIVLTSDNTIVLNTEFTGQSVAELIRQAKQQDSDLKSGYPIYLFLDTPGGSIQAGLELVEFLNGLNRPVHTITLFAASMGWQLLQHLGDRYVLKYGQLMSHKAYGGFRGEFGGGGSQLDSRYSFYLRRLNLMDQQTVDRTKGKKTLKEYQSDYDNELWLNGDEAVESGYADEVVQVKCDKGLTGTRDENVRYEGLNLTLSFDKCPIVTYPVDIQVRVRTNKGYMPLDDFMAKGGKFGTACDLMGTEEKRDWNGVLVKQATDPEICLMDTKLTLDSIDKIVQDKKDSINNVKKNIVKMNFGNFISDK